MRRTLALMVSLALVGCGYRPLRSGLAGTPRIRVEAAVAHVPGGAITGIADEAALGARGELAKWGALAGSDAKDRLRVEVVRLDEASEGIGTIDSPEGALPRGRGVRLRVTARGTVEGPGGRYETRDVEATEVVAAPEDPLAWDALRAGAVRTLARTAGALVAREVLGIP